MKHAVLHEGVLVAKRKITDGLVFLFQLEDFYVETYCSVAQKRVLEYRVFKNLQGLEPYLEQLDIPEITG